MPDDIGAVAVAEPANATESTETVETSTGTAVETGTGAETGSEVETGAEQTEVTPKTAAKTKLDLATVVKTKTNELKAIDPNLPQAMRTAAFELGGLYREFPGGLKEAVSIKTALSEIGGVDGLKEQREAIADYSKLESLFEKGDPAFIESLADSLPQSFSQIMPAGLERWKQADAEMYNHTMARVLIQTMDSAKVSDTIEKIWAALDPKTQEGERQALAYIWQTLDGYRKAGEKAPERKTNPQEDAFKQREQQLAERETRALLVPVANAGKQQLETITDREMGASYQWAATDESVKQAVRERIQQEVVKASKADKSFTTNFETLKARKDASALERHIKAFQDKVTPAIAQRVAKLFAVKPKGGPVAVKKAPVAAQATAKTEQGWVRTTQQPKAGEIDYSKTNDDMIMDGKAVLKGGKRVQWL
jgi:hypothetical protein